MNNADTSIEAVERVAQVMYDESRPNVARMLRALAAKCDALFAEVERCHERLEIDHVWKIGDGGIGVARVDVPMSERAEMPDAVTCRDATIELLESTKDEHIADRKAYGQQVAEAALREADAVTQQLMIDIAHALRGKVGKLSTAMLATQPNLSVKIDAILTDPAAIARILETGK